MKDDISTEEAKEILALIKFGDPGEGWESIPELPTAVTSAFGVTDKDGKRLRGIVADFTVKSTARPPTIHYVFTIYKTEFTAMRRVYQLDVQQGGRKNRSAHALPHEHLGRERRRDAAWISLPYEELLKYFCEQTSLTLIKDLPDPNLVTLR